MLVLDVAGVGGLQDRRTQVDLVATACDVDRRLDITALYILLLEALGDLGYGGSGGNHQHRYQRKDQHYTSQFATTSF